ncbi:GAF domain-containing protein [Ectothiorhodospiraceae bacterium 2226]|nr:GAF domain-containing protein [Ectothiorhodospiraceae bacterium 2226]
MIPPASGWRHKGGGISDSRLFLPLLGIALALLLLGGAGLTQSGVSTLYVIVNLALMSAGLGCVALLTRLMRRELFLPLAHLRNWALRLRGGNLAARIPVPARGEFAQLAHDINELSEALQVLSRDMEGKVRAQTERIAHKTASLKILYDVAASINGYRDLDELLERFLHVLKDVTGARAGTVRLLTDDAQLRMVASTGLPAFVLESERLVPVDRCLCGSALVHGEVCGTKATGCERFVGQPMFDTPEVEVIAVPLVYRGRKLGIYNLFVDAPGLAGGEDSKDLLTTIGQHLGMAIEKARLDEEARRLAILEERTQLGHELHDSLAQTLASLRFQAGALEEALDGHPALDEARQMRNGVQEAYTELRSLIAHFRCPVDQRGLLPALEQLVAGFRTKTGIAVFVQSEWNDLKLPPELELQVLRVAQEALCNVRAHSQARNVRILLSREAQGICQMLVEDDGVGLTLTEEKPCVESSTGEHIGFSVMKERAQRLGGTLSIDSEPGEGTRVLLTFREPPPPSLAAAAP